MHGKFSVAGNLLVDARVRTNGHLALAKDTILTSGIVLSKGKGDQWGMGRGFLDIRRECRAKRISENRGKNS